MGEPAVSITGVQIEILPISIVVTLINCFCGYKMHRIWIGLVCFLIGMAGGATICVYVVEGVSVAVATLVGAAFGALLTLLSLKLCVVGVFLFAAGSTIWMCLLLLAAYPVVGLAVGAAIGLLTGFLATKFTHTTVILLTGVTGGLSAFQSILLLIPVVAVHELKWLPVVGGSVLAILGIFMQYRTDTRQRRVRKQYEEAKAARHAARQETEMLKKSLYMEDITEELGVDDVSVGEKDRLAAKPEVRWAAKQEAERFDREP